MIFVTLSRLVSAAESVFSSSSTCPGGPSITVAFASAALPERFGTGRRDVHLPKRITISSSSSNSNSNSNDSDSDNPEMSRRRSKLDKRLWGHPEEAGEEVGASGRGYQSVFEVKIVKTAFSIF